MKKSSLLSTAALVAVAVIASGAQAGGAEVTVQNTTLTDDALLWGGGSGGISLIGTANDGLSRSFVGQKLLGVNAFGTGVINAFENDGDLVAWWPEDPKARDKKTPAPIDGIVPIALVLTADENANLIALQKDSTSPAYIEPVATKTAGRVNPWASSRDERCSMSQLLAAKFAETTVNQAGRRGYA